MAIHCVFYEGTAKVLHIIWEDFSMQTFFFKKSNSTDRIRVFNAGLLATSQFASGQPGQGFP
jgi:hypothetical protein